jgi:AsmA protein
MERSLDEAVQPLKETQGGLRETMQDTQQVPEGITGGSQESAPNEAARADIASAAMMAAAGYSAGGEYADEIEPEALGPQPLTPASRRRMIAGIGLLVALGLAAVLPPLINVNRYQRRIVTSISTSLGRPVHLDSVTLNLLPLPSFTLTNFVVSEDPSFGAEPVIRANSVRATLRLRSLWLRRVEFSRISLDEPSVNLVRRLDGRWNIESILLQASRMPAEPTAQKNAGASPRFPYIEATGGRVNLKQGLEKKAISLTDAEFALWLSEPNVWRLRLEAHPARTDTAATDTGTFRLEGTLGRAESLATVPVDLRAEWNAVPLGAASWVVMGADMGVRGDMNVRASVKGTVGTHQLTSRLELHHLRRADFVPAETLDVDMDCRAQADRAFRLSDFACSWPGPSEGSGLTLTGQIPDARHWQDADLEARWTKVPVSGLLDAMRVASSRDSSALKASGLISGELDCCDQATALLASGSFEVAKARLSVGDGPPVVDAANGVDGELTNGVLTVAPIPLALGGTQPALLTVSADKTGLRMRLTGFVLRPKLMELGKALPVFGDGLASALPPVEKAPVKAGTSKVVETPVRVDLAATRNWGGVQVWAPAVVKRAERRR